MKRSSDSFAFRVLRGTSALAVVAAVATVLAPSSADACRCMPPPADVQAHAKNFDTIFLGTVIAVSPATTEKFVTSRTYTFKVDTYWKGDVKRVAKVSARTSGAACGTSFNKGAKYLVFAGKSSDGKLSTTSCAFNKLAAGAAKWLKGLGEGRKPGGKIEGPCPKGQLNVIRCIKAPCPIKCEPVKKPSK